MKRWRKRRKKSIKDLFHLKKSSQIIFLLRLLGCGSCLEVVPTSLVVDGVKGFKTISCQICREKKNKKKFFLHFSFLSTYWRRLWTSPYQTKKTAVSKVELKQPIIEENWITRVYVLFISIKTRQSTGRSSMEFLFMFTINHRQ